MILLSCAAFLVLLRIVYSVGEIIFERDWPRRTWRGLITAIALFFLCACAFGQLASRVDIPLQTTGPNIPVPGGPLPQAVWLSNATVQICVHPASLFSCTPATTYNDSNEDAVCPSSAPMVQLPGVTCTNSTGTAANVGFWFGGGTVDYIVTPSYGGPQGPFSVTQLTGSGSFVKTSPSGSALQTVTGPLSKQYDEVTAPVPFSAAAAAFFGYNQAGTGNVDLHAGNGGGFDLWTPNNSGTGWTNILRVDNTGTVIPANGVRLASGNCYYLGGASVEGICDDQAGGINISTTGSATNGIKIYRGNSLQFQIDASGNFDNSSSTPLLLAGATGTTGTGNIVYSASPALTGTPTAPTGGSCASNTNIATQAYVGLCAGGGSGVTTLALTATGSSGAATGNITGATLTLNIPQYAASTFHADVNITGAGTIAAQACSAILQINLGAFGSFGTGAYVSIAAQSNYTGTTGWSPIITPITPTIVPDPSLANYVDVKLCNTNQAGGASITPSLFGGRILVVP